MKTILLFLATLLAAQFANAQCMGTSNITALSLNNGALVGGTANTIGAKYRFSNAASGVDVLVTIVSLTKTGANTNNFTFITTDAATTFAYGAQAAVGGFDNNLQPYWLSAGAYYNTGTTTLEAGFKFELSDASANGTTVVPVYRNLVLESIDNDGGNTTTTIQEEVAYSPSATAYALNNPTTQINVAPDTYRGPNTNQPNIGTGASYISYAYYFNTSSFTWYSRHYFTVNSAGNLGEAARLSSLAVNCSLSPANINFPVVDISGNVFNDVNALSNGKVDGVGIGTINSAPLKINLVNGSGIVIASTPVAANGTYKFYSVKEQSSYTLQLSTIAGTVGSAAPANQLAPNWVHTGQNNNTGTGNDGNVADARIAISVSSSDVTNINFGIQRGPESGFNVQPMLGNPSLFFFVSVPNLAFLLNNIGLTPGTSDYDGGTVDKIRITAFPSNTNALKIGSTTYTNGGTCPPGVTCQNWPVNGVTINFNILTGILTPISVDPFDGSVNIVIPFAAIDNGGLEDPTPGSISQPLVIVLPLKIASFDVAKNGNKAAVTLVTTEKNPNSTVTIERSTNGMNFTALTAMPGGNSMVFQYADASPVQNEKNYYRAKITGANGETVYSDIKMIRFTENTRVDVYPVPTSDVLNITWNHAAGTNISIQLYSPSGQLVLNKQVKEMTSQTSLDISRLQAGYYIIKVAAGEEILAQQKIIKQ